MDKNLDGHLTKENRQMADGHKRQSGSAFTRDLKILTVTYHHTPISVSKIQKVYNII